MGTESAAVGKSAALPTTQCFSSRESAARARSSPKRSAKLLPKCIVQVVVSKRDTAGRCIEFFTKKNNAFVAVKINCSSSPLF